MGCDGGTIPKRHELVRMKKKPEQKDKDMERNAKWCHCAVSQEELKQPIVACELGFLYNKESIIEVLLEKVSSTTASHIRNLKDIKELNLTRNPDFDRRSGELADQYHDTMATEYVCPVVGVEMNGKYKFCFLWSCGCVMSERALKEVPGSVCHKCGVPFNNLDVVYLNPEGNNIENMREKMKERRLVAKLAKQAKKNKKAKEKKTETSTCSSKETSTQKDTSSKDFVTLNGLKRPLQNSETHFETKKNKTDKVTGCGHSLDVQKTTTMLSKQPKIKETNKPLDPSKRSVYKNLFTSSEQAKGRSNDKKAHWVTYNPYHL